MKMSSCLFALLSVWTSPHLAHAADCGNLMPVLGELGYGPRSGPVRCEGLYRSLVAGEIELLSFLVSPLSFDPQADKSVAIDVPKIASLGNASVAIVARALPLRVYYRMDASTKIGDTLTWPLATVVAPAGLDAADLGVIGFTQSTDGEVFIPLDVHVLGTTKGPNSRPTITFRAPMDLDLFEWKIDRPGVSPPWKKEEPNRTIRTGDAITFPIDGPTGQRITLEIAAKPTVGDWIRTKTMLFVP
jgi:hypothetical protein